MKVAILRAVGDGGLQDPRTGNYVSSKRDTIVPYSDWAESLVNHGQIKVIEVLENSEYSEYVNHLGQNAGDENAALASYRKVLPSEQKGTERMRTVESPADLERQETKAKPETGKAAVAKNDAPAAKPAAE